MKCEKCGDTGEVAKDILCSCETGQKLLEGGELAPHKPEPEKQTRAQKGIAKAFDFADSFLDGLDAFSGDDDDTDYDTDY